MKISSECKTYNEYTLILHDNELAALLKLTKFLKEEHLESTGITKEEYITICDIHNKMFLNKK